MIDPAKQRFIDLLEEDASRAHQAGQAWRQLEKHGAQLEDGQGKVIAMAAEMAKKDEDKEQWLRGIIAKTKAG
jgi:hypothetical protein